MRCLKSIRSSNDHLKQMVKHNKDYYSKHWLLLFSRGAIEEDFDRTL